MGLIIGKSQGLFRADLRQRPAQPLGDRVFVRPHPIEDVTEGGLAKPEIAKERQYAGTLLAAGDQAADKLYELGVEIGDEIWYAKYAGIIEEWHHIVKDGAPECTHDSAWDFVSKDSADWSYAPKKDDDTKLRACRTCGALRVTERVILMSTDDLACDVDLQRRLEAGAVKRVRGVTDDGRPRYYIEYAKDHMDGYESRKDR